MSKLNHGRPILKDIDFNPGERRFSKGSVNGTRVEQFTPGKINELRRRFLVDCAYAEIRGTKMPGVPKAMRHIIRCAKGMNDPCVRKWVTRQDDYGEAKSLVLSRESRRPSQSKPAP